MKEGLELAFENHRLFDLIRTGQFETAMKALLCIGIRYAL